MEILAFLLLLLVLPLAFSLTNRKNHDYKVYYGRNPEILEIEEESKKLLKQKVTDTYKANGKILRSDTMTFKSFLEGEKPKFKEVTLEEVLKSIDEPTISYKKVN